MPFDLRVLVKRLHQSPLIQFLIPKQLTNQNLLRNVTKSGNQYNKFRTDFANEQGADFISPAALPSMAGDSKPEIKVLVVCLGNICRSPMGEAVLRDVAKKRGINVEVDSAGTAGYHVGEEPDERTVAVCRKNKVPIDSLARQVATSDFINFTYILASDENNLRNLERIRPSNGTATVRLWGSYLDNKPIPDPYYGGLGGFDKVYDQCVNLSNAFLDEVTK
ncbi:phosphotyrosine protein phosphatase I superfamily [Crepidotus variabilis]|uniref:Phosphotyrosine protein phosphatase I superfamily n=1 Tax=Crepidotus variabilis TaxID=179855 RepID=A0A9P6EEY3_9AGAR|nr:phosphotyrosine protein phosphatase I superfamily [Crepidotus variabilis]